MLDFIIEQIAELQKFYTNVSETFNASELQEVLSNNAPANECKPDKMNRPGEINKPDEMDKEFKRMN